MTDRLTERLQRQFARDAARSQPQPESLDETLARHQAAIEDADRALAEYRAFTANRRPSTPTSLIGAFFDGVVSVSILASFLLFGFIIFAAFLLILNFLGMI